MKKKAAAKRKTQKGDSVIAIGKNGVSYAVWGYNGECVVFLDYITADQIVWC